MVAEALGVVWDGKKTYEEAHAELAYLDTYSLNVSLFAVKILEIMLDNERARFMQPAKEVLDEFTVETMVDPLSELPCFEQRKLVETKINLQKQERAFRWAMSIPWIPDNESTLDSIR